ncbi:hypothetical protein GGX14DRAFT_445068, partial [Mycena pura]
WIRLTNGIHYLEPIGDALIGAVEVILEMHVLDVDNDSMQDRIDVWPEGENIIVSDRMVAVCFDLPRKFLLNPDFDLIGWYGQALLDSKFESESYNLLNTSDSSWDEGPPSLRAARTADGEINSYVETDIVMAGEPAETIIEDRFNLWARAAENYGQPKMGDLPARSRQLGDVVGNTVAVLLDFFQIRATNESHGQTSGATGSDSGPSSK